MTSEDCFLKTLFGQFTAQEEEQEHVVSGALLEAVLRRLGACEGNINALFSNAAIQKDDALNFEDFSKLLGSRIVDGNINVLFSNAAIQKDDALNFGDFSKLLGSRIVDGENGNPAVRCSMLLRRDTQRVAQAMASPQLELALSLAYKISEMSTEDVITWSTNGQGLARIDTVSFFPLTRNQHLSVTVCVVIPASVPILRDRGFELISKYGKTFLPLDVFDWSPSTHSAFIEATYFSAATDKLTELGLVTHLMPMITFKGKGLLLKYHMPQPELKEGTENPQAREHAVWTISVTDATPPEVLKIGMRAGTPLLVPWNPFAFDVCIQEKEDCFQGDWVRIKDADYSACHFVCRDA